MTVDNQFKLYINGRRIGSGNHWTRTYSFRPSFSKVTTIAIEGRDRGGPAGLIGVFNGKPTRARDWKCKNFGRRLPRNWMSPTFDDSRWPTAKSYGKNSQRTIWHRVGHGQRRGIPSNAEWIWTRNNNNHNRVICRMSLFPRKKIIRLTVRSGYKRVGSYLSSMQRELLRDMRSTKRLDVGTRKTLDKYNSRVLSMQKAITRTKLRLRRARSYNSRYTRQLNKEYHHRRNLMASLRRQRKYIAVEHRYINKMEREALGLKRTSPHYKAIQNEIRQMRTQMKKEISDVEAAYANALKKTKMSKHNLSKKRSATHSRIHRLSRLLSQYKAKHRQFQRIVSDVHRRAGIDGFTIKALSKLNHATIEFQSHVRQMARKHVMLNFSSGYSQCRRETRRIKRFYRRARCTKN
jgi:hypothetical protein